MARGGPAEASSSPPFPSTVPCPLVPPIIPKHLAAVCRHCEETTKTLTRGEREGAAVERSVPVQCSANEALAEPLDCWPGAGESSIYHFK